MATFNRPSGLAICKLSQTLYVADSGNDCIRAVCLRSGGVNTITLTAVDPNLHILGPKGLCMVYIDYDYDEEDDDMAESSVAADDTDDVSSVSASEHVNNFGLEGIAEETNEDEEDDEFDMTSLTNKAATKSGSRSAHRTPRYSLADDGQPSRISSTFSSRMNSTRNSVSIWSQSPGYQRKMFSVSMLQK